MNSAMLDLQANIIMGELRSLEMAAWSCETHELRETARQLRLTIDILRASANLIRLEAKEIA